MKYKINVTFHGDGDCIEIIEAKNAIEAQKKAEKMLEEGKLSLLCDVCKESIDEITLCNPEVKYIKC